MHDTKVSAGTLGVRQLRLFLALLETGNLHRAAAGLGISEPSGSRELARLRLMLDDPLFRKTATGMVPTTRALALAPAIGDALERMERLLAAPSG